MCKHFQQLPQWALKMVMMKVKNLLLVCCQAPKLPPLPQFLTRGCRASCHLPHFNIFLKIDCWYGKDPPVNYISRVGRTSCLISCHGFNWKHARLYGLYGLFDSNRAKKDQFDPPWPPIKWHFFLRWNLPCINDQHQGCILLIQMPADLLLICRPSCQLEVSQTLLARPVRERFAFHSCVELPSHF